ncbi:FAD-binding oxidoreductase [Saccharothrix obliqua]|uniref:FAD-binding oxidoreductase n=1 Tax=Saccharothrix obliqua TaxID=2861747 RepID=UPI001C5CED86|nr:FAD-binding oxidoreductase [Saccharothrix obliqua]MBW4717526.1 FAD-binding oxidoreductase [Saccharothrix obliqua]
MAGTKAAVVTPADARYPDLVRGLNQRWVGRPDEVVLPTTTAQVADAVREAVRAGRRITAVSGGHCFEDFAFNPEVRVVVNLAALNRVYFDHERGAFAVEAGARLLDVYEKLYRFWGVTLPAGVCYTVGAGGHVAGGGFGFLSRRFGLVVDHLHAVEVVVVDGRGQVRTVVATREEDDPNRDLWWAHTGGGGGNFGIVTRYWFRSPDATGTAPEALLPVPPPEVFVVALSWSWQDLTEERFTALVRNYGEWHAANSAPDSPYAGLFAMLILGHRSNGEVSLICQLDATTPDARRLLDDFLAELTRGVDVAAGPMTARQGEFNPMPELAAPRTLPWLQATRLFGTTDGMLNDPSLRIDYKSAYMRRPLPPHHIAALYKHLTRTDIANPSAAVQLHSFGGRINAVDRTATASAHRDSCFKLIYFLQWTDESDDAASIAWLREFYEEVYADTGGVPVSDDTTDGCYVNYPDIDLGDPARNRSGVPWHDLYYAENYPRLQRVKAEWDPHDVFRHGQSVRLP